MSDADAITRLAELRAEYEHFEDRAIVTELSTFGSFGPQRIRLRYRLPDTDERQYILGSPDAWTARSEACLLLAYLGIYQEDLSEMAFEEMDSEHLARLGYRIPVTITNGSIAPDFDTIRDSLDPEQFPDWTEAEQERLAAETPAAEQTLQNTINTLQTTAEAIQHEFPTTARHAQNQADQLLAAFTDRDLHPTHDQD